ncbi:MAG: L,D-transpeptidase family protein [Rickettsiales bacterium]|jgi:L,D-transpeptidase ErfK/SrfK
MRIHTISIALYLAIFVCSAQAATYKIDGDVVGEIKYHKVKEKEDLYVISRRYGIGIVEMLSVNHGVDAWRPKKDTDLTITTSHIIPDEPREGIVINLSELRLFYFPDEQHVMTFPIAIGRKNWETQQGTTKVARKRKHPTWTPPESIRKVSPELPDVVPAGKDNPLGDYAMSLGWQNYVIHGTNRPYSVGKRSSHGCIRLYPEDIEQLFAAVEIGTKVTIIDEQYKLGWQGDNLFLEILPTQKQTDIIARSKTPKPLDIPEINDVVRGKAGENAEINWQAVEDAVQARNGIPTIIAVRTNK